MTARRPHVGPVRRLIGRTWLKAFGWHVEGELPDATKAVFVAAPHTSNWDLPFTLAIAWTLGTNISWIGKDKLFRPPFGTFMRALGGVPIVRGQKANQVDAIARAIRDQPDGVYVVIAPSGTRSKKDHWKSGFYRIAEQADVPMLLGFLDYEGKRGGLGPALAPSGDMHADMEKVRAFYADKFGKFKERMSDVRLREEEGRREQEGAAEEGRKAGGD
jgi:1-acyl-sn-glycerol-3-phosphate acyltransferase